MKKILVLLISILLIPNTILASTDTLDRNNLDNYGVNKHWDIVDSNLDNVLNTKLVDASEKIYDFSELLTEEEEKELRKKQIKRGQSLLEKLEEIRDGMLRGYLSKEKLIYIARFVNERKIEAQDARLNEIIEEIELRVQVELAKLMK